MYDLYRFSLGMIREQFVSSLCKILLQKKYSRAALWIRTFNMVYKRWTCSRFWYSFCTDMTYTAITAEPSFRAVYISNLGFRECRKNPSILWQTNLRKVISREYGFSEFVKKNQKHWVMFSLWFYIFGLW